jgi:hypothetical protein
VREAPIYVNPEIHVGAAHQKAPISHATSIIDHYTDRGTISSSPYIEVTPVGLPPATIHNNVVVSGEPQPLPQVEPVILNHPDSHHVVETPSATVHPNIPEPTIIVKPIVRLHETTQPGAELATAIPQPMPATCGL